METKEDSLLLNQYVNTHKIEMLLLLTLYISAWGCLIRSDYNFVFLFFTYFYLVSRKDKRSINIIFGLIILLQIMDIIFFIFIPSSWLAEDNKNPLWNNLHSLHRFAIFCSVLEFLLKLPILFFLFQLRKQMNK